MVDEDTLAAAEVVVEDAGAKAWMVDGADTATKSPKAAAIETMENFMVIFLFDDNDLFCGQIYVSKRSLMLFLLASSFSKEGMWSMWSVNLSPKKSCRERKSTGLLLYSSGRQSNEVEHFHRWWFFWDIRMLEGR